MKEILKRFKKEILEHEESKNYDYLIQIIDLELFKIKQKEEILKLNLKDYKYKIEIKTMQEFIEVQNLAFLLNCGWRYGSNYPCKKINDDYDTHPVFVFIGKYLTVGFESDRVYFENHINKQISINELKIIAERKSV